MFQKFFDDTLSGRFVKALLCDTSLPIYECVVEGDTVFIHNLYYYKNYIIRCIKTGVLTDDNNTDSARYEVISVFDENNALNTCKYISKANYYDSDTHFQLGKYLSFIKSKYNLNLFPYYNCYCNHSITDIELSKTETSPDKMQYKVTSEKVITQKSKVIGLPIRLNGKYKIAIDSGSEVLIRCVIRNSSGFIDDTSVGVNLADSSVILPNTKFKEPFSYNLLDIITDKNTQENIYKQQRNLWLIIQLPKDNTSSVVVYDDVYIRDSNVNYYTTDADSVFNISSNAVLNPSLTFFNTNETFAFSNRLVEYLVNNVITENEEITQNVSKVQQCLYNKDKDYKNALLSGRSRYGLWDQTIKSSIYKYVETYAKDNFILDQDGNVNKDVEKNILLSKGADY